MVQHIKVKVGILRTQVLVCLYQLNTFNHYREITQSCLYRWSTPKIQWIRWRGALGDSMNQASHTFKQPLKIKCANINEGVMAHMAHQESLLALWVALKTENNAKVSASLLKANCYIMNFLHTRKSPTSRLDGSAVSSSSREISWPRVRPLISSGVMVRGSLLASFSFSCRYISFSTSAVIWERNTSQNYVSVCRQTNIQEAWTRTT